MKFSSKTSYAVAMLLSTSAAVRFLDQTWDLSDQENKDEVHRLGHQGYLIDSHLIDNPPDMIGGMKDWTNEKDAMKGGVNKVAEELGLSGKLMFNPEELKQPEDAPAKPKVPVEENNDAEEVSVLQLDYLQRQHEEHMMQIEFESSENRENQFNDELAKEIDIKKLGANKYLNGPKKDHPMFFVPKKEEDASGAKQLLNSVADEGETAEAAMEANNEAEAAEEKKEKTAVQINDEASVILGNIASEGDAAEAELNSPVTMAQKKVVHMQPEEFFDGSNVQVQFVDMVTARPQVKAEGVRPAKKGDVAGVFLNKLLDEGAEAEQNIMDETPQGAVMKAAREKAFAKKKAIEEDGYFDDSEVQLRFAEQDIDKTNDELAEFNNIKGLGSKGYLIEGEIAQRNFTYFPPSKSAFDHEGADEIRQFLNSIKDSGDEGEEGAEELSKEEDAKAAEPAAK